MREIASVCVSRFLAPAPQTISLFQPPACQPAARTEHAAAALSAARRQHDGRITGHCHRPGSGPTCRFVRGHTRVFPSPEYGPGRARSAAHLLSVRSVDKRNSLSRLVAGLSTSVIGRCLIFTSRRWQELRLAQGGLLHQIPLRNKARSIDMVQTIRKGFRRQRRTLACKCV